MNPETSWTQVYTDGSATNAVENRGAGIYIMDPSGYREEAHFSTAKHCTNYAAEVVATIHAAHIISTREEKCSHVVFLTLGNNKLDRLSEALHPISSVNQVVLQWIPAHCGIPGNENADRLAKLSAAKEQEDNWVNYEEMKSHIKSLYRPPKQTVKNR
ncbi:uncharacterized protein LOC121383877 [Gigantopelta aegis]|uniref:uncharacterized protein LOC121383877 n=1 Tax=Gigantopelta aegis TaxID=1735272 RepID=UPI001B889B29|nr:uncharacterized protein LOC121383877 [Gigantopelta aegis]